MIPVQATGAEGTDGGVDFFPGSRLPREARSRPGQRGSCRRSAPRAGTRRDAHQRWSSARADDAPPAGASEASRRMSTMRSKSCAQAPAGPELDRVNDLLLPAVAALIFRLSDDAEHGTPPLTLEDAAERARGPARDRASQEGREVIPAEHQTTPTSRLAVNSSGNRVGERGGRAAQRGGRWGRGPRSSTQGRRERPLMEILRFVSMRSTAGESIRESPRTRANIRSGCTPSPTSGPRPGTGPRAPARTRSTTRSTCPATSRGRAGRDRS